MPVVKIPVVQKFGIISTKYHHALQQRLLQSSTVPEQKHRPHRPLEITEDFIKQFNSAEDSEEKERMLDTARKILLRCKRRSKINPKGSGNHVDLHLAWTELILLAQCKGNIEEEAIDILLISMDQVNFNQENISLLFFMAESILYRICCDVAQKPCLCSSDVKLSKLGFLTFLRLYVFYLLGQLEPYDEQKERLSTYLQALQSCRSVYEPFPNVQSSVHIMLKVGTIICSLEVPSGSNSSFQENPVLRPAVTKAEGAEINSFVWYCLEIWLHVQMKSIHLQKALHQLCQLNGGLLQENWLDSLLGLFILGEAAKLDISCLKTLLKLAHNFITSPLHLPVQNSELTSSPVTSWPWEVIYTYIMVLSDICLHGTAAEIQKHAFTGFIEKHDTTVSTHETSLHGLLFFMHPQASEACNKMNWIIHYGTVYNLVKVCNVLHMDVNRSGLRNAIWKALNRCSEKDNRVIDAVKVAEAELNGPANTFITAGSKTSLTSMSLGSCQYVGLRVASVLSQHFLPPVVPYIPLPNKQACSQLHIKLPKLKERKTEKIASRPSLREQYFSTEPCTARSNFLTRTNMDLQKVMDEQWEKELKIKMEEDKEDLQRKQQENQRAFYGNNEKKGAKVTKKH